MKLLLHSNAPWAPTGYGQQCATFAPMLAQHYDLAISSFYGLEGAPLKWQGIPVLPGLGGEYGNVSLPRHAMEIFDGDRRGGLVLTLMDVWVLSAATCAKMNMACWVPVDHQPAPPAVVEFFMESGAVPIAMSRFGWNMLGRLDPLYVPHGIDTDAYQPQDRNAVREKYGFPADAFLVGMVAANKGRPSRKGFQEAFEAFARFAETHDNAYLYLHTMLDPSLAQGEDIPVLLEALNIPADRVRITDQYRALFNPYPHTAMAQIYSAMDVLLNPAHGEGFGIPVLEAQACGVPAIVTDSTAMSEVCGAGWRVKHRPRWTGQNSWQSVADVDDIVDALEDCYSQPSAAREALARQARTHALGYAAPRVFEEHWLPSLKVIERRFSRQAPVTIPARSVKQAA
jgi:glycosyltransferase involved in cell wall biosynthesis